MSDRTETISGIEYAVIAEHEAYQSYEWSMVGLIRRADGQLFVVNDGGCSCNGPWEGRGDLTEVATWQEAVEAVKADRPYEFDDDDIAAFAEKCMNAMRPEATR